MRKLLSAPLFALLFLFIPSAFSQSDPATATAPSQQEAALTAATEAARKALRQGPADVPLSGQAVLRLPANFGYVPPAEAGQYLEALGNPTTDGVGGLVVPIDNQKGDWFVVIGYMPSGYIKDDDAKEWDADELLESLRAGTEEDNKQRAQMGIPGLEIVGWVEPPKYDESTRRLVWSIAARNQGQSTEMDNGINYNTYALGREGYFSLNLVTAQSTVMQDKPAVHALLSALQFDEGKRYTDFNPDTDRVAEYGLAALVAGAAAKKVGLLAAIAVFLAKFWKLLLLGAVGVGMAGKKWFNKKDAS
jgi:uncharacterized membrane-anchored protein